MPTFAVAVESLRRAANPEACRAPGKVHCTAAVALFPPLASPVYIMPPVKHPHPFEDLVELAKPITYDPQRSLKEQFSAVDLLRRRSEVCRDEGDLENQYIYLGRAAAIINEHLPHHSQYNMITAKRQAHLAKVRAATFFRVSHHPIVS